MLQWKRLAVRKHADFGWTWLNGNQSHPGYTLTQTSLHSQNPALIVWVCLFWQNVVLVYEKFCVLLCEKFCVINVNGRLL